MIESLMCIGSLCEGHEFAKDLGIRIKGPVDNLAGDGFYSIECLFSGIFRRIIIEKSFIPIKLEEDKKHGILPVGYKIGPYTMIHNDLSKKETYREMFDRVCLFEKYLIDSRDNNSMYYLYTLSETDELLTESDIRNILNKLPDFVQSRIITLHTRYHNPEFMKFFPGITYKDGHDFWNSLGSERTKENFKNIII